MQKIKFIRYLFLLCLSLSVFGLSAQVQINENFDAGLGTFTGTYDAFAVDDCNGESVRENLYSSVTSGNLTSANQVAASNGTDLTISFDYKIENWNTNTATGSGWGSAVLEYSTDAGTTWNPIFTIDDSNHTASTTCANITQIVPAAMLPASSDVQIRILNTWVAGDYDFYVDDFAANQVATNPPNCDATLTTPTNGAVNIDPATAISWSAATGIPDGYVISIGTTPGGTDIENALDVGNVTTYTPTTPFSANQQIYVTIVPYNASGSATGCTEESFTIACESGAATLQVDASDCANDNYSIIVDVTSIGSAASINITTDDAGGSTETGVGVGTYTLTGFTGASGTVTVTIDSGDPFCDLTGSVDIPTGCPPANDFCLDAMTLTCGAVVIGTNVNATANGTACGGGGDGADNGGVWYTFIGTGDVVTVSVNADPNADGTLDMGDSQLAVYSGDCTTLVCEGGSDDATPPGGSGSLLEFTAVLGTNYYFYVDGFNGDDIGEFEISVTCVSCATPPAFTLSNGGDNCPLDEFFIDVDITNLNGATTVNILNDGGIAATNGVDGTATPYSIGPFPSGTAVEITVEDAASPSCFSTASITTTASCPPSNDDCTGAVSLTVDPDLSCTSVVSGTTVSATESLAGCVGTADDDVWYSFMATGTEHRITINNTGGSSTDIVTEVFDACGGTSLVCQDTPNSPIDLTGLTSGTVYYFRIYTFFAGSTTTFEVCVGTPVCSITINNILLDPCTEPTGTVNVSFDYEFTVGTDFNVYLDGTLVSTIANDGSGSQSTSVTVATDGASHTVMVEDATDNTCVASDSFTAFASPCPNIIVMPEGATATTNTCEGIFTDPGGQGGDPATDNASGNYPNCSCTSTQTICSDNGGTVTADFTVGTFDINSGDFDILTIYDGATNADPLLYDSNPSVGASPGVISSTGTCLTFEFFSSGVVDGAGWEALISCASTANPCVDGYEGMMNQLTGMLDMNADYETDQGIDSDQVIGMTTPAIGVDYDAAIDIDLLPGFEVKLGVTFDAFIDGCQGGTDDGAGGNQ